MPNEVEEIMKQPQPRPQPRPGIHPGILIATSVVMLFIGVASGWSLRGTQGNGPAFAFKAFAERAIGAHVIYAPDEKHPVEVGADQETHLVDWLSQRLGSPLQVPDLGKYDFALIGGRLLPDDSQPAAQLMFEDTMGRRVTVYVRSQESEDTSFRLARTPGGNAFYWVDSSMGYALAGDIARDELLKIANDMHDVSNF